VKIDYTKFKKVHSDANSSTLQHPDGHYIKIAHNALSEGHRVSLDAVPMMAAGGEVAGNSVMMDPVQPQQYGLDAPVPAPISDEEAFAARARQSEAAGPLWKQGLSSIGNFVTDEVTKLGQQSMGGGEASSATPVIPKQVKGAMAPGDFSSPDLGTPKANNGALMSLQSSMGARDPYASGIAGLQQSYKTAYGAQKQLAEDEQKIANDNIQKQQQLQQHYQDAFNEIEQSRKDLVADIKAGHINPDQYMDSKSDLGKISTAIGLIMGGIGGGASGTSNPALDFINKQIDRDIDAQKTNLGKKHNLLSATMQQFGNIKDAENMARVYQADIYKAKMEEAMAKAKSPMSKAALQESMNKIELMYAPQRAELNKKMAIMAGMKSGAANPAMAVQYIVEDKDKDKARTELANIENSHKAVADIDKYVERMNTLQSVTGRLEYGAGSEIDSLNTQVMAAMKPILGALSEADKAIALSNAILLTDPPKVRASKAATLKQMALKAGVSTPTLDGYGIYINKPSDKQAPEEIEGAPKRK
jgi:hypothetical protein